MRAENNRVRNSLILSLIFMGAGQAYNKLYIKGFSLFLIQVIGLSNLSLIFKNIKGLITLGEQPQRLEGLRIIQGDHSIFMMVEGLINLIFLIFLISVYIYNVIDAKREAIKVIQTQKFQTTKSYLREFWEKNFIVLMLSPGALSVIFLVILPIILTVLVAFTNYSSPNHIPPKNLVNWVGFTNFINIYKMKGWAKTFYALLSWTFIWAALSTILNYVVGLLLALITLRKDIKFKAFWKTIFILPWAIPGFVSLLVFRLMFSNVGPLNNLITSFGFDKIGFFSDPLLAKIILISINTWLGAPYFMVLLSSSLTNIDSNLYEAAKIDGANKWSQFKNITIPLLLYQTAPILTLSFAFNFNNFSIVYLLTGGGPPNSNYRYAGDTDILITWVYKLTKDQNQYQMAGVVSIILFFFIASISTWHFVKSKSFKDEDLL